MIVSWKLVRASLALSACLGLLAACQDRGQFKSKKWTPEQIEANLAAKNARETTTTTPTEPTTPTPTSDKNKPAPPGPTASNPAPPGAQPPKNGPTGPGALSQTLTEDMMIRDKFVEANVRLIKEGDLTGLAFFKGVTVTVQALKAGTVQIAIDAAIQIGKDLTYLSVAPSAVSFDEKDVKPTKLAFAVQDQDGNALTVNDDQVKIFAVCKDATCSEVHIRIQVATEKGPVQLALVETPTKNGYVLAANTLGAKLVSFEDFTKSLESPVDNKKTPGDKKPVSNVPTTVIDDPTAAPKNDKKETTTPPGEQVQPKDPKKDSKTSDVPAPKDAPAPTPKSVVFKPAPEVKSGLNLPTTGPLPTDLKTPPKTIPPKDPGVFTFTNSNPNTVMNANTNVNTSTNPKPPGILGATAGLTNDAIQKAPPVAPEKVETKTPPSTIDPVKVIDDSAAAARKESDDALAADELANQLLP